MGIRVHVLADEIGISAKDLIALCHDKGIVRIVKHMQAVSEGEARMLREEVAAIKKREAAKEAAAAAKAAAAAAKAAAPPPTSVAPAKPAETPQPKEQPRQAAPAQGERPRPAPARPPQRQSAPQRNAAPGARPDPPPETEERRKRGAGAHKPKTRAEETEQAERARRRLKPIGGKLDDDVEVDKVPPGMVFTDFTAGGVFSGTMAGSGVGYQRRTHRPKQFGRRRRPPTAAPTRQAELPPSEKKAILTFPVTVRDLSSAIGIKANDIIRQLMENQVVVNINQPLANDMVQMIAMEHGWEIIVKDREDVEDELEKAAHAETGESLESRIPVVTILGHVDHGKTSLLDRIRNASVAASESGGITQHIGAYNVIMPEGKRITFLDTPGHEAFTAMRARGANCTDIVVLVVAADDGVMPQTQEAISHAKAAEVPIIIALNKIDLPAADPARVKPQLAGAGLELEEWGGDVPCVEVSAVTGKGIPELLEMILLVSELREFKANPRKSATGVVLEANLTEGRGAVATVLIRNGTLKVGDVVLCGAVFGKVRSMHDDLGRVITEAGPSIPVQISGLTGVSEAGDKLITVSDLQRAREVADMRSHRARIATLLQRSHVTLENLFGKIAEGQAGEVRVVLKADVMGSMEPLVDKLASLSTKEVKIKFIHTGVGAVNESDVLLADASDAIIIAFRVVADARVQRLAEDLKVDLRFYQIIFQPVDDMRSALSGLLKPERRETITGHATVRQIFKVSKAGNIAGCQVTDGNIANDSHIRLARNGIVTLNSGRVQSLRRIKDDVRQVQAGMECGIKLANFEDIKEGDVIEAYRVEEIARSL